MNQGNYYNTLSQQGIAEFKDRGSRFIAYAFPVTSPEKFKELLMEVKRDHPKASHHCFAYRLGFDRLIFRVSDDGEPSGTAGKPILGQLDSKEIINAGIIVVRYFGGTLLGVPGLINAYRSAASMALQVTPVVQKPVEEMYKLHFDYTRINEIMTVVKQMGCTVLKQDINLFCDLEIGIPRSRLQEALYRFSDIRNLELKAAQ